MQRKRVAFVVLSGKVLIDVAGPADVFGQANKLRDIYEVELMAPGTAPVNGEFGIAINGFPLTNQAGSIDTQLIAIE